MKDPGASARVKAIEDCRTIAETIAKLGNMTNKELAIVLEGKLDSITIIRRLRSGNIWNWPGTGYFVYDNTTQKWGITDRGRKLFEDKK